MRLHKSKNSVCVMPLTFASEMIWRSSSWDFSDNSLFVSNSCLHAGTASAVGVDVALLL